MEEVRRRERGMRRWLREIGLVSVGLLAGASAWGQSSLCTPDLQVSLSSALSRPGETVPVQVNIERSCPERCFSEFGFSFYYPEGVAIDEKAIMVLSSKNSVYGKEGFYGGPSHTPSSRHIGYYINGSIQRPTGPVLTIPVHVRSLPSLSKVSLILQKAWAGILNYEFCINDPQDVISTLQVTGMGTGRGDVDGDGSVTTADVQWALRLLLNTVTASPGVLKSADAWPEAGDGQITLSDALSVLRLAVGLE
jgi:hypothetical protein